MTYNATIQSILDYYGTGSTIWNKIQTGSATAQEISYALSQIPQVQMDLSQSGTVLGFKYADPVYLTPTGIDDILDYNSNIAGGSYGGDNSFVANIPANFSSDGGNININGGSLDGLGHVLSTVADRALLGVTGVNIGAKLGKAIDSAIYNLDPNWWDENYPNINPDKWVDIAGTNELGQSFIRTLFNIKSDGSTAYVDERMIAQTYQMLRDLGLWDDEHITGTYTPTGEQQPLPDFIDQPLLILPPNTRIILPSSQYREMYYENGDYIIITVKNDTNEVAITAYSKTTNPTIFIRTNPNDNFFEYTPTNTGTTLNGTQYYCNQYFQNTTLGETAKQLYPVNYIKSGIVSGWVNEIATILYDGTVQETSGGIDGISSIDGATQYPPTNITGTDLDTVLQQLKQEYPDLFTDSITESVLQPDGTITTNTYVPVPWVATDTETNTSPLSQTQPTTAPYSDTQTHINIDSSIATQILTQTTGDNATPPPTTPPVTGDGDTPISILPTGSASALWSVYNPTQAQVDSFGAWLWSSNFIEQIKKLFADPMQAIIGIHKVFCTPITGETRNIICGYIDSGVSSKIVTNQYASIDCGSVSLREYFGSVMDYAPYTKVKIYLPFIGIVPLDVSDIMRSTISVKYRVDVFTGACLANVEITRDNAGGTLYTYSGSAIVSYPLSSGSYAGIISGVLSAVTGIATSALTGGNPIPAIMGAGSAIMSSHTDVSHHGSFTGCAGAMGIKIPYLIITRPQVITPNKSGEYYGYSAPFITKIGTCDGYIKCKETHVNIPNATVDENNEINDLLISGIYIDSTYTDEYFNPPSIIINPITIYENGTYTATGNVNGYNPIYVDVTSPAFYEMWDFANSNPLVGTVKGITAEQTDVTFDENGAKFGTLTSNMQISLVIMLGMSIEIEIGDSYETVQLHRFFMISGNTIGLVLRNNEIQFYDGSNWVQSGITGNDALANCVIRATYTVDGKWIFYKDGVEWFDTNVVYAPQKIAIGATNQSLANTTIKSIKIIA